MLKRISFLILLLFIACSKEPPDSDGDGIIDSLDQCPQEAGTAAYDGCPAYTLTVNSNPSDGGFINPNGGTVKAGQQVSLTATPADEFLFEGWSGAETGTAPTISVIMDKNKSITANFVKKQYKVKIDHSEGGTVEVKTIKQGTPTETDYNSGTVLELTAIPDEGYEFQTFYYDDMPDDYRDKNPIQITIIEPVNIYASFFKKKYSLKVNVEGNGKVNASEIKKGTTEYVDITHGSVWGLHAIPDDCSEFVEWTGDISGTENPIQIVVKSQVEVTANFETKVFSFIPQIVGDGAVQVDLISGSGDRTDFDCGSELNLTAIPKDGYAFEKWEILMPNGDVAGERVENPTKITLYEAYGARAIFKEGIAINISIEGDGQVNLVPDKNVYIAGDDVRIVASPEKGNALEAWGGDLSGNKNTVDLTLSKTLNIDAKFSNPIYLDDNNITVKAKEWSKINDEGVIDGEYYRVVNEGLLKEFIEKEV